MGGFGEVYLATMKDAATDDKDVAVKILHPGIDPTAQAIQRLQDEARLLGLLQHPSIIRVVDLLQYKGRLALVTEYVDGEDLSGCFLAIPPPSPRAMIEVVGRVANALDAAWRTPSPDGSGQLQLIHRDLKPSNIRISRTGDVKLLDFGLAHADHADRQAHTEAHTLLGSFMYMAPERYLQRPATSASDAFALGCCLYEGLAGEKLFEGRKPVDLYGLLLDSERWDQEMDDRIAAVPSTVPTEARHICRALLAREPDERMTVTELADTWEDVVEAMGGPTLSRWAASREWGEPEVVRASLEGSVVVSRVMPMEPEPPPPDPHGFDDDDDDDDDDCPTVLVRTGDYDKAMAELAAFGGATVPLPRHGHPYPDAEGTTVARQHPKRGEVTAPMPRRTARSEGSRMNWVGAGLLATTTVIVSALVVGVAAVVLVTWITRDTTPTPIAAQPPPAAPAADAHLQVDGVSKAWLRRGPRQVDVGPVPPGMWTLWVDFGDGEQRVGTLRIPRGERIVVPCEASRKRCSMPGDAPDPEADAGAAGDDASPDDAPDP